MSQAYSESPVPRVPMELLPSSKRQIDADNDDEEGSFGKFSARRTDSGSRLWTFRTVRQTWPSQEASKEHHNLVSKQQLDLERSVNASVNEAEVASRDIKFLQQSEEVPGHSQRTKRSLKKQMMLREFLLRHRFNGINTPKWKATLRGPFKTFPLHVAAKNAELKILGLLIEDGANLMQKDSKGRTAYEVARKHNFDHSHAEVLAMLVKHGNLRPGCSASRTQFF